MTVTHIRGTMVCAAAALGLAFAATAHAQPYGQPDYGPYGYGPQDYPPPYAATPYANGVVVTAPPRHERTFGGAEVDHVTASRVVDISDLDLSTRWGVHELRARVERAAADVCNRLDNEWPQGLYPLQGNDADCYHRAVVDAMAQTPVGVDADYTGY